ncbi:hypothetical protein L596_025615 [Steinernema carpocapsae]|nr:hypothetical protein L596_025615 [Steinernema carpocapsae]
MSDVDAAKEMIHRARAHIAANLKLMGLFSSSAIEGLLKAEGGTEEPEIEAEDKDKASEVPEEVKEEAKKTFQKESLDSGNVEDFQSQFDEHLEDPEEAAETAKLDETLLDGDSLMLIPTQVPKPAPEEVVDSFLSHEDDYLIDKNPKSVFVDSFLVDDAALFTQMKPKESLEAESASMALSEALGELSFEKPKRTPARKSLARLALDNSRRGTLEVNTSLNTSTSSLGLNRSEDLFSSPSPDSRNLKKRVRNSSVTASPTLKSPCPKASKMSSFRTSPEEARFEIVDVCESNFTWNAFLSDVFAWTQVGISLCFSGRKKSLVGLSFCSSESTPKFLTISESAVCGNEAEELQYPSCTPAQSISTHEKIRFVFDLLESTQPKFFGDFLATMRSLRALNVLSAGITVPKIKNCICLKTLAYLQQVPMMQRGSALWNLALKFTWPPYLELQKLPCTSARIQSAALSYVAARIYAKIEALTTSATKRSVDLELKSVELLAEMEWTGFRLNRQLCQNMTTKVLREMEALEAEGAKLAGCAFSFESPRRVAEILFVKLGIPTPPDAKGKTHFATNSNVLKQIQHPLARVVLRWRKLQNALTCSLRVLQSAVGIDGRIHTFFDHLVATGRVISTNPNVQNIPKEEALVDGKSIRSLFTAADSMVLLAADFSQLELRVLAHLTQDRNLRTILNEPSGDVFESMCQRWNSDPSVRTKVDRQKAKQLCYAMIYGMGVTTLAEELKVNRQEAQELMSSFFRQFPKVRVWIDERVRICRERGFVDTMLGRKRPLSDIISGIQKDRAKAERQAVNSTIQGTASEIFKLALLQIREKLKSVEGRIVMQIHDEVIVEVPTKAKNESARIVRSCMEAACTDFSVRLPVKISSGPDWGSLRKM